MKRPTARQSAWQWQERIGIRDRKTLDGDQSLFFNRLMDLGDPLEDYDAVNKKYVDDVFGDGEIIVVIGSVDDIADLDLDPGSIAGSDADAVMAVHLAAYDHTNIHPSNIIDGDTVDVSGRDTGDVLTWNGAMWVPAPSSGWLAAEETWTYASSDSPTFTFTVPGDNSTKYYPGMRIKLTQTTVKYFIITKVVYSSPNTTVTVYGGTDYTLANEAIIYPYYSSAKAPAGFPLDPAKWTVTFTDSTKREQATPTASTWYNLGSLSVAVPIGAWRVRSKILAQVNKSDGAWVDLSVTISTGNNNESTPELTDKVFVEPNDKVAFVAKAQGLIVLASKTTHYFNAKTGCTASSIEFSNDQTAMVVKFECAYL